MRKANTPTLKQLVLSALFATAAVSISHASTIAESYEQRSVIDFENLAIGASPTVGTEHWAAWTGSANVAGRAPLVSQGNASDIALQVISGRESGFSSQQVNPFTASDNVLYFSAQIYRTNSSTSGARILIDNTNAGGGTTSKMAGFGVMDVAGAAFAFYDPTEGVAGTWISSDMSATHSKWWEVSLVITINETDISKSLASLYVRNLTDGQTDFTLVTFNGGTVTSFEMSWLTDERNVRDHFQYWRYTNFRSDAQIDNLAAGVIAIPEPSVALLGIGGLLMIPLFKNRLGRKS